MQVEIPEHIALRIVEFLNMSAGEGLFFMKGDDPYILDPASILFDWFDDNDRTTIDWWPEEVKKEWS